MKSKNILITIGFMAVVILTSYFVCKKENNDSLGDKNSENKSNDESNTEEMADYIIDLPIKYKTQIFDNGLLYDSIKDTNYSFQNYSFETDENNIDVLRTYIKATSEIANKIESTLKKINKEISVKKK